MIRARKTMIYIGLITILLVVAMLSFRQFSFSIALLRAGLDHQAISFVEQIDVDANGKRFSVLQTTTHTGTLALVRMTENAFGFWSVSDVEIAENDVGYTSIAWVKGAGVRRYEFQENPVFEQEWHIALCGNDAQKAIALQPEHIPENCTVNVQQAGEAYMIHLITFSQNGIELELRKILEQNAFVKVY